MTAGLRALVLLLLLCTAARADDAKLTLAEAYRLALRVNERVAIARAGVEAAGIERRATWNQVSPAVDLTAQAAVQNEVRFGDVVSVPGEQLVARARVQQPVFRKGFFATREASGHRRVAAAAELAREQQQLARDVVDVYIGLVRARALRDLAKSAVDRTVALRDHTVGRVKAGGALRSAELLAQLDVQRAQRQLLTVERDLQVATAAFVRLVGRAPTDALELPAVPPIPERGEANELARRRPDLEASRLRIAEAEARVRAAEGQRWWPTVDVEASVQAYAPSVLDRSLDWRLLGVLTVPLFQRGEELTGLALRKNQARVAALDVEAQRKLAVDEVEVAAIDVATTAQVAKLTDTQLKTAREHYNLVDKQFRLGAITFLEVTNAEAVLTEAENAFEIARSDRVRAAFNYLFVIGAANIISA